MKEKNKTIARMEKDTTASRLEKYTKQLETIRDQIHGKWTEASAKLSDVTERHDALISGLQKILAQDKSSQDIASKRLNQMKESIKKLIANEEEKIAEQLQKSTHLEADLDYTDQDVNAHVHKVSLEGVANDPDLSEQQVSDSQEFGPEPSEEDVLNSKAEDDDGHAEDDVEAVCIKEEVMDFQDCVL